MDHEHSENPQNIPNDSEVFRTVQKPSETFRSIPNISERSENHTLTAREVTRMFEDSGVARTERSIINWCRPDKYGSRRLDCFFDHNERKYYITPQSVELAIKEEQAKIKVTDIPNTSENKNEAKTSQQNDTRETRESVGNANEEGRTLRAKVRRLEVETEVNKRYIEKLEEEREKYLERMLTQSHQIGLLEKENEQLQIEAPKKDRPRIIETPTESKSTTEQSAKYAGLEAEPIEDAF